VDGLVKKAYENWNQVVEYEGESLLNLNQPERLDISQTDPVTALASYSTVPLSQFPEFAIEGWQISPL